MVDYARDIRLRRLLYRGSGRALLLALDATFVTGTISAVHSPAGLTHRLLSAAGGDQIQGILGFAGFFRSAVPAARPLARIMRATGGVSTNDPRDVRVVARPMDLVRAGADVIAIHLYLGHARTPEMLSQTGRLIGHCHRLGYPVLVAAYNLAGAPGSYDFVRHAATVAHDLDADAVKFAYPGSPCELKKVVAAIEPTMSIVAGGPVVSDQATFEVARVARDVAAGICFGRSVFEAPDPERTIVGLAEILHGNGAAA